MTIKKNPYINPTNYWEGYHQKLDKDELPNQPDKLEFLAWCVFEKTNDGKSLLEEIERRYVMPGLVSPSSNNYSNNLIFMEGFKHAFRTLRALTESHKNRLKSENNKVE